MPRLTNSQLKQLHALILDAFDQEALDSLLFFDLSRELARIVSPKETLPTIAREIIRTAEREGWTPDLLRALKAERPQRTDLQPTLDALLATAGPPSAPAAALAAQADEGTVIRQIERLLADTWNIFIGIDSRRQQLSAEIEERLDEHLSLDDEAFFFHYFNALTDDERKKFDQLRYKTETLSEKNKELLTLLNDRPQVIDEIPSLELLRQHLDAWVSRYKKVFDKTPEMCMLWMGQVDKVGFPVQAPRDVAAWLAAHPRVGE